MIPFDLTIKGTGQVIERLRKRHSPSLTQEALADKVGCLKSDISRYEGNQVGVPFSRLVKLAEVFGLTPEGLLQACLEFARENGVPLDTYNRIVQAGSPAAEPEAR